MWNKNIHAFFFSFMFLSMFVNFFLYIKVLILIFINAYAFLPFKLSYIE